MVPVKANYLLSQLPHQAWARLPHCRDTNDMQVTSRIMSQTPFDSMQQELGLIG